jgi:hypothetical protein
LIAKIVLEIGNMTAIGLFPINQYSYFTGCLKQLHKQPYFLFMKLVTVLFFRDLYAIAILQSILKVLFLAILDNAVVVTALGGTYIHQFKCDRSNNR